MQAHTSICVWFYPTGRLASPFFLAGVRECQPRGFIPALHTQRHSTQATNLLPRTCSLHGYKHNNCFPRLLTHDSSISFPFFMQGTSCDCFSSFQAYMALLHSHVLFCRLHWRSHRLVEARLASGALEATATATNSSLRQLLTQ